MNGLDPHIDEWKRKAMYTRQMTHLNRMTTK